MPTVQNNKFLLFFIGLLLLSNIAMFVFFVWIRKHHENDVHREKATSPITEFLEKQIGFNKQQMGQFESLRKTNRKKMKPLFEDIRSVKVQFYHLLSKSMTDSVLLREAAVKIGNGQTAIDLQAFRNFREVRKLCNPEQVQRYDSLIPGIIEKMWFPVRKANKGQKGESTNEKR